MKTIQIMERQFYDGTIKQNHKDGWLCATDLLNIGNRYRESTGLKPMSLNGYFKQKGTQDFITTILDEEKLTTIKRSKRGKGGDTFVHPLIFIDICLWLNPKFKYVALQWLKDRLLESRDSSGDSYKAMVGALDENYNLGAKIGVIIPRIARQIKSKCGVEDWNSATEDQLSNRDKIHNNIMLLCKAKIPLESVILLAISE